MKKLLAIDTATEYFSVCYFDGINYHNKHILGDAKSSSYILDMIAEFLPQDTNIDGIIYSQGPGAFTGIRVGLGVVSGLSLAKNIPTLGFSTLEVLEFGAKQKFKQEAIISCIDARMGEVYLRVNNQEILTKPEDFDKSYNNYVGVGTGFVAYDNFLGCKNTMGEFYPQAQNLIKLALQNIEKLSFNNPEPVYLRNNVAKKSQKL